MDIRIERESPGSLDEYEKISIAYQVKSRIDLGALSSGQGIRSIPCSPYLKDYDLLPWQRPSKLVARYEMSAWGIFACFLEGQRVGGVIAAPADSLYRLIEDQPLSATIVDLRVAPNVRRKGVGSALIAAAISYATQVGCKEILVETQDTNLDACQFYASKGFEVKLIDRTAYDAELNESQIIWELSI